MNAPLTIKVALQIQKPSDVVYEAIVDPHHMTQYFISTSSGRMEEDKELLWSFPEFEGEDPIQVDKLIQNQFVSFKWNIEGHSHLVEIMLESRLPTSTLVTITEKERENDESGLKWLKGNTEGWANFLCCLKAYLEHGINLRKGGFDYLIKP